MLMPMMQIRVMRMAMRQRLMGMRVRMRTLRLISFRMIVLMMVIVDVSMFVRHTQMTMLMPMPVGEQEDDGRDHQRSRNGLRRAEQFADQQNGKEDAKKGRGRERHLRPSRSHPLSGMDIQHDACPV